MEGPYPRTCVFYGCSQDLWKYQQCSLRFFFAKICHCMSLQFSKVQRSLFYPQYTEPFFFQFLKPKLWLPISCHLSSGPNLHISNNRLWWVLIEVTQLAGIMPSPFVDDGTICPHVCWTEDLSLNAYTDLSVYWVSTLFKSIMVMSTTQYWEWQNPKFSRHDSNKICLVLTLLFLTQFQEQEVCSNWLGYQVKRVT